MDVAIQQVVRVTVVHPAVLVQAVAQRKRLSLVLASQSKLSGHIGPYKRRPTLVRWLWSMKHAGNLEWEDAP